jgi:hypothetical protein
MPYTLSRALPLLSRLSNDQLRTMAQGYRWKARAAPLPEMHDALIRAAERLERVVDQRARATGQRYRTSAAADTPCMTERALTSDDVRLAEPVAALDVQE